MVFKTNKCCTSETGYVDEKYEATEKDVKVRKKMVEKGKKKR